jgi:NAD(P)H-nitrite reductase large subunit
MTDIHTDYLIIGGGVAGTTAAETIREYDGEGSISILTRENHTLYSRVMLPEYVEGRIRREQVYLRTSENYAKYQINLYVLDEAIIIDVVRKVVETKKGKFIYFKKLLIASGGSVKPWNIPGSDSVPIMRLHTIEDADALRNRISYSPLKEAVVVGGGFIGLEFMNTLLPHNFIVHCFLTENGYWQPYLDDTGSGFIERHLTDKGVIFHHQRELLSVADNVDDTILVQPRGEQALITGLVGVGIGLLRDTTLFTGLGLDVDRGIKVNNYLESAISDIWVAGDIAEYYDVILEKYMLIGNWNNSFMQGHIAGKNMAFSLTGNGERKEFRHVSSYTIDVQNMHITFLGDVDIVNDNMEMLVRTNEETFYERFFISNGHLVGAILINKFSDKTLLERIIQLKIDITPYRPYLINPRTELSEYIQV